MSADTDDSDTEDESGSGRGIKTYIVWILAVFLILGGVGMLFSGDGALGVVRSLVAGALFITAGIVAISYTTRTEHLQPVRTQLPASTIAVVAIILAMTVVGGAIAPPSDDGEDTDPDLEDAGGDDTPTDAGGSADDGAEEEGQTTTDPASKGGADDADTPAPTDTAAPTATATQTATPRPSLGSYQYSGSGQRVTDSMYLEGGLVTFAMDHDGDSNFQVELIDEDNGETEEYLANEIGTWEAEQPHYIPEGNYVLDVNADGNWNIDVEQPRPAPSEVEDLPAGQSNQYPNYIGPVQFDGFHTIRGEYHGDGNFVVWVLDEDGHEQDLIFNEIGEFEGESTYSGTHVGYIRIEATGEWTVEAD